jgi:hypothetical protein
MATTISISKWIVEANSNRLVFAGCRQKGQFDIKPQSITQRSWSSFWQPVWQTTYRSPSVIFSRHIPHSKSRFGIVNRVNVEMVDGNKVITILSRNGTTINIKAICVGFFQFSFCSCQPTMTDVPTGIVVLQKYISVRDHLVRLAESVFCTPHQDALDLD